MKKKILLFVISTLLVCFWLVASVFINPYEKFTSFIYGHSSSEYITIPKNGFSAKGAQLIGKFVAQEDNLGVITVQVSTLVSDDNNQKVLFTLRNDTSHVHYYEHAYYLVSTREGNFLYFGFPKITDSKNKTYIFSITSLNGTSQNAVNFAAGLDAFKTIYVYSLSNDLKHKLFVYVIEHKLLMLFSNLEVFFSSTLYLLPLIFYFYLATLYRGSRYLTTRLSKIEFFSSNGVLLLVPMIFIFLDIILIQDAYIGITIALLGLWIITMVRGGYSYKYSLVIGLVFFLLAVFFAKWKVITAENIFSNWTYYFLFIGITHMLWPKKRK